MLNNTYFKIIFNCLRYIREWAEYKKTDAYKEFRRQQMEQKEIVTSSKKIKHNPPGDTSASAGNTRRNL